MSENDNEMILARIQGVPAIAGGREPTEADDNDPNIIRGDGSSNAVIGAPVKKHITTPDGNITYLLPRPRP